MADRMVCLSTLTLQPGARLAKPVSRADGVLLLPAGEEIDVDQLQRLIQRDIEYVYVLQEETRAAEDIEHDIATEAARVAHLFRGAGSDSRLALATTIARYREQVAS